MSARMQEWVIGSVMLVSCAAHSASACSIAEFYLGRSPGEIRFLGTAASDTAVVPRLTGRTEIDTLPFERTPFGQTVLVQQLGTGAIEAGVPANTKHVLLVAWSYDSMCRIFRSSESARWSAPGATGMYWGTLRDERYWADGVPVVDVFHAYVQPYTGIRKTWVRMRQQPTDSLVTPAEMLALHDRIPLVERSNTMASLAPAARAVIDWARENPRLALRAPARELVVQARYALVLGTVQSWSSPLAGTWRFVVSSETDSVVFHARTELHPVSLLFHLNAGESRRFAADGTPVPYGYMMIARAWLPNGSTSGQQAPSSPPEAQGYFTVADSAGPSSGAKSWRGGVDLLRATRALIAKTPGADTASFARLTTALRERDARHYAEGQFTIGTDGVARFAEEIRDADGRLIARIEGRRLVSITW